MLTSHSRAHGAPPKEPWEYGPSFMDDFRRAAEMKYRLMPYVYAQAKDSSRARPADAARAVRRVSGRPGLVDGRGRVPLRLGHPGRAALRGRGDGPQTCTCRPGGWIDYQTGRTYAGGWQQIEAGEIPAVILVRDGAAIPHAAVAQSTARIDWTKLELVTFVAKGAKARGLVCLPSDDVLHEVAVDAAGRFLPSGDPLAGKVRWTVRRAGSGVR